MNPKSIRNPHRVKTVEPFHSVDCYRLKYYCVGKGIERFVIRVSHNHQYDFPNPLPWRSSRYNMDMGMSSHHENCVQPKDGKDFLSGHSDVCRLRTINQIDNILTATVLTGI